MSINIEVSLLAQRHHHGGKPVKDHTVKSAAVSKLMKLMNVSKPETSIEAVRAKQEDAQQAKPYGSHNGGTHVKELLRIDCPDGILTAGNALKVSNICNTFEGLPSIDIKSMKKTHAEQRDALNKRYKESYGDRLTQKQMTSFKNDYAKLSFVYWTQQIIIKVTSEEPLENGRKTADGLYVIVYKTKTVYTREMMPASQVESLARLGSSDLTEEVKAFSTLSRVGGIFVVESNGRVGLLPDRGQGRVDAADQY